MKINKTKNESKKAYYEIVARLYANEFIKENPEYAINIENIVNRVKRILHTSKGRKEIYSYFKKVLSDKPEYLGTIEFFMEIIDED